MVNEQMNKTDGWMGSLLTLVFRQVNAQKGEVKHKERSFIILTRS